MGAGVGPDASAGVNGSSATAGAVASMFVLSSIRSIVSSNYKIAYFGVPIFPALHSQSRANLPDSAFLLDDFVSR